MPRWIDFHDSTIEAVCAEVQHIGIRLRAYMHDWTLVGERWHGSGWSQPLVVRLRNAASGTVPVVPVGISSGWARVGATTHENGMPVPFRATERTKLSFRLVTAEILEIEGDGIDIEIVGEPRFVENLPDELRPFND